MLIKKVIIVLLITMVSEIIAWPIPEIEDLEKLLNESSGLRNLWPQVRTEEQQRRDMRPEAVTIEELYQMLDLHEYPVWKVHKYEGIEIKPVLNLSSHDSINSKKTPYSTDSRRPVAEVLQNVANNDQEEVDLSFLDDLGGLAYILPDPLDDEKEKEIVSATGRTSIMRGFFDTILTRLFGYYEKKENDEMKSEPSETKFILEPLANVELPRKPMKTEGFYYLPGPEGSYVAIRIPQHSNDPQSLIVHDHSSTTTTDYRELLQFEPTDHDSQADAPAENNNDSENNNLTSTSTTSPFHVYSRPNSDREEKKREPVYMLPVPIWNAVNFRANETKTKP